MERGVELEVVLDGLLKNYLSRNLAARVLQAALDDVGVGFRPVVDHLTIRTLDIDRRAEEFLRLGYAYSETLNYDDWFAKVYRTPGFPPMFIDQAYPDARGAQHHSRLGGQVRRPDPAPCRSAGRGYRMGHPPAQGP